MYGIIFNLKNDLNATERDKAFLQGDKVLYDAGFYNKFGFYVAQTAPLFCLVGLMENLKKFAPYFCENIYNMHVFKMEDFSDITNLIKAEK